MRWASSLGIVVAVGVARVGRLDELELGGLAVDLDRADGQVRAGRGGVRVRVGRVVRLEVEAEVGQALGRQDRLVDVRARQEPVRRRVVDQVRVRVDALVAAVAALGVDDVAERGDRVLAGRAGVVRGGGRGGRLPGGHRAADGVAARDVEVARAGGARRGAADAPRGAGGEDPRALGHRGHAHGQGEAARAMGAHAHHRAAEHARRAAAVQQADGHTAVRRPGARVADRAAQAVGVAGHGVRGQRLDAVDRHERARRGMRRGRRGEHDRRDRGGAEDPVHVDPPRTQNRGRR